MKKAIKDYLHLYLGQLAQISELSQRMIAYGWEDGQVKITGYLIDCLEEENVFFNIKPILRQLSDMTEEEMLEVDVEIPNLLSEYEKLSPVAFRFLLSHGFDLFGLIEAGLAIDKTPP